MQQPASHVSGSLFVLSAPSGAGKTSLVKALVESTPGMAISVSHTTRGRRDHETHGVHYHFVDGQTFESMLEQGDFLESAQVFGHAYGTSEKWVREQLAQEKDVILEIDWQGARQVREALACVSIFVLPPTVEDLQSRLRGRGQDNKEIIAARMRKAVAEMSHYGEFDYLVVNDDFDKAVDDIRCIIRGHHLRIEEQSAREQSLISALLSVKPEDASQGPLA